MRSDVAEELRERLDLEPVPALIARPPYDLAPVVSRMISLGFRTLARRAHPDTGGDHGQMVRIIQARDWLRQQGLADLAMTS